MDIITRYQRQFAVAAALIDLPDRLADRMRAVLDTIAQAAYANQGALLLWSDARAAHPSLVQTRELTISDGDFWARLMERGVIGFARHAGRAITVRNLATDARWFVPSSSSDLLTAGSAGVVTFAVGAGGQGALLLLSPQLDHFNGETIKLLEAAVPLLSGVMSRPSVEEGERLRRDLTAMVYHDLRNPLQNIQASLYGIERLLGSDDIEHTSDFLATAAASTQQISRMIKSLLDFDRLESSQAALRLKPIAVEPLIREAAAFVRPALEAARHQLHFAIAPDLPTLLADEDMLQRVVINLIENAAKYSPDDGRVTVRAQPDAGGDLVIGVSDTGPGVPPPLRADVFDKYFRVRHENAPAGLGLGLAFCKLAVEAHGGHIWIEDAPDGGALFVFRLPALAAAGR